MKSRVCAIVLAAGLSRRMGHPKLILPWGKTTVIGNIIQVLQACSLSGIIVVTGGARDLLENELKQYRVTLVFNPKFSNGEMVDSVKTGLSSLPNDSDAALIVLGDQPQIESLTIQTILKSFEENQHPIIMPSFNLKRGHPWLIRRDYWAGIMNLANGQTMRDFFNHHQKDIHYEVVGTSSIFMDIDTPEDYQKQKPR